ncbi:MAG: NAD(P)H-flavin reductase [Legionellaceae bacterium]|nr:NAD(P)H-flavin reductase [Legionellaceae bacterium]
MKKPTIKAQVVEVVPLTNSILQLVLQPQSYYDYQAGQYLEILIGGQWLAYSIANAPLGARHYELHIRHSGYNPYDEPLFAQIKAQGELDIRLPYGRCSLEQLAPEKPLLLIAGGTGLAPCKAMMEQLLATDDPRPFELWWAVRERSDLYLHDKLCHWQSHVPHFNYYHFLATHSQLPLVERIRQHYGPALLAYQIVLAGPFDMVYATRDTLLQYGVSRSLMHADAFDFEEES